MKRKKQAGFTLIEIIVALAISAAIGLGAAGVINALYGTTHASQDMQAVNTIENAASWINQDVLASQTVSANMTPQFIITLEREWVEIQNALPVNSYSNIVYRLNGTNLERNESKVIGNASPVVTNSIVARDIDNNPTFTHCSSDRGMLSLTLTSNVGSVRETRDYQLKVRPDVPQ